MQTPQMIISIHSYKIHKFWVPISKLRYFVQMLMADATVFQFSTCCGKLEPILKHLLLCCLGGNLNFLTPQNGKLTNPNNKQETIAPKQQKQQEQQYRQQSHWITMGIFHIAEMQLQNAAYRLPTHTHTHTPATHTKAHRARKT